MLFNLIFFLNERNLVFALNFCCCVIVSHFFQAKFKDYSLKAMFSFRPGV